MVGRRKNRKKMHMMSEVQREEKRRRIVGGSNDINDISGIWWKQKSRKRSRKRGWEQYKQRYMIKGKGERGLWE